MAAEARGGLTGLLDRLESAMLRSLVWLIRLLSLARASALGGWLGRRIGPWLPVTRVARANLAAAFPQRSAAAIEAIVAGMWANIGRTAFEFAHLDHFRFTGEDANVVVDGLDQVKALADDGRGAILFSAHFANWELLGGTAAAVGLPLCLVYRAPNNPRVARLYDTRRFAAVEMIPKGAAGARRVIARLRSHHHFGILVDQKMNDGIAVPFFGRAAMTAPAVAELAFRFEVPVVPVRMERLGGVRFRVSVLPPLAFARTGDHAADVLAAMTEINAILEGWIRERPEQWLWLHRRWPKGDGTAPPLRR